MDFIVHRDKYGAEEKILFGLSGALNLWGLQL